MRIRKSDVVESLELFDGNLILDIDKKGDVVALEVHNFTKELRKEGFFASRILCNLDTS